MFAFIRILQMNTNIQIIQIIRKMDIRMKPLLYKLAAAAPKKAANTPT